MRKLVCRHACAQDIDQLCQLYIAFHEFHVRGVPDRLVSLGEPEQFDRIALVATLKRLLDQTDVALFVAVNGDQVIGLAEVYLRQDEESDVKVAYRYGHLQSLIVEEEYRHHQVGTRLVEKAQQWATRQGASEMRLEIWEFAAGPLRFYERLGYRTLRRTLVRSLANNTIS